MGDLPAVNGTATRIARLAGMCRDVCMLAVGVLALLGTTPRSLTVLGLDHAVTTLWALSFIVGAVLALFGGIIRAPLTEAVGCWTIGGGFLVWTAAIVVRPDATTVSWTVALVFLAGVFGQIYRGVVVTSGLIIEGSR